MFATFVRVRHFSRRRIPSSKIPDFRCRPEESFVFLLALAACFWFFLFFVVFLEVLAIWTFWNKCSRCDSNTFIWSIVNLLVFFLSVHGNKTQRCCPLQAASGYCDVIPFFGSCSILSQLCVKFHKSGWDNTGSRRHWVLLLNFFFIADAKALFPEHRIMACENVYFVKFIGWILF